MVSHSVLFFPRYRVEPYVTRLMIFSHRQCFFIRFPWDILRHSPTVIAAAITSQMGKAKLPTHIELAAQSYGLPRESVVLLEQIRTLDKKRLRQCMGHLDSAVMEKGDNAIAVRRGGGFRCPQQCQRPGRPGGHHPL